MSEIWEELSRRALHCLCNAGLTSEIMKSGDSMLQWVKHGIRSGAIAPGKVKNYGRGTHIEVCLWAGLKKEVKLLNRRRQRSVRRIEICRYCRGSGKVRKTRWV